MSPESIFQAALFIALAGWLILILVSPLWFRADRFIIGVIISLLALIYSWLIISNFNFGDLGKLFSPRSINELFNDKVIVTAGWVHYLALGLFAGTWIKKNAFRHGISHWLVIPCLVLTMIFGPAGLLLYLVIRYARTRQYFTENF